MKYEAPVINVIRFQSEEVIVASAVVEATTTTIDIIGGETD